MKNINGWKVFPKEFSRAEQRRRANKKTVGKHNEAKEEGEGKAQTCSVVGRFFSPESETVLLEAHEHFSLTVPLLSLTRYGEADWRRRARAWSVIGGRSEKPGRVLRDEMITSDEKRKHEMMRRCVEGESERRQDKRRD